MSAIRFLENIKFNFPNFLAFCIVMGCFCYFFWVSSDKAALENHNVGEIKTAMIAIIMSIVGFYFGSSQSSKKDRETISEALTNKNINETPVKTELSGTVELKQ